MILDGVRALYQRTDQSLPAGLSNRVSSLAGKQQERELLIETWHAMADSRLSSKDLEGVLMDGLLTTVHGEAQFIPAKAFDVEEQLRGNRYVGIGVGLGMEEDGGRPSFASVFPEGVAHKAGIQPKDRILEIDGVGMKGKRLEEVVDLIRGPEGSTFSLLVQRPGESETPDFLASPQCDSISNRVRQCDERGPLRQSRCVDRLCANPRGACQHAARAEASRTTLEINGPQQADPRLALQSRRKLPRHGDACRWSAAGDRDRQSAAFARARDIQIDARLPVPRLADGSADRFQHAIRGGVVGGRPARWPPGDPGRFSYGGRGRRY